MKCIYCLQEKEKNLFNREHIIPKAFGTFGTSTPTLIDKVCASCNQSFGDGIDNSLSRSGINFDRHSYKVFKKTKDFLHQKHLPSTKINITSGKYEGLEVELSSNDSRKITNPKADFGLIQANGSYKYYSINNLPSLEEVNKAEKIQEDGFFVRLINNIDQVRNIFKERYDISLILKEESEAEKQECSITFEINSEMIRSVYKIAFNFLADYFDKNNLPNKIFDSCFDPVRRWISNGIRPQWNVFTPPTELLTPSGVISDNTKIHHSIELSFNFNSSVAATVIVYNHWKFDLFLALNYRGITGYKYVSKYMPTIQEIKLNPLQQRNNSG